MAGRTRVRKRIPLPAGSKKPKRLTVPLAMDRPCFPCGEVLRTFVTKTGETATVSRYRQDGRFDELFDLRLRAFNRVPGFAGRYRSSPRLREQDRRDIQLHYLSGRNDFVVAEINGRLAGCVRLTWRPDLGPDAVEFNRFCVEPEKAKQGIGREMYRACYELARKHGFRKAYADTTTFNKASLRIHRSEWKETGETNWEWTKRNGSRLVLFEKKL